MTIMRTTYRILTAEEEAKIRDFKLNAQHLYDLVPRDHGQLQFASAEFRLARERIEEAVMWAVKGLSA